jgi:endoglucanase
MLILPSGGLLYYPGDSDPNSLNPALNAAMLMTRYSALTSNQNKRATYIAYAKGQVDYVLGKNPMSGKLIPGWHTIVR